MTLLSDLKIAMLVEHGVNQTELTEPREALEKAGIIVEVISPEDIEVKAWQDTDWGIRLKVDYVIADVDPNEYDALILPGGIFSADKLRANPLAIAFVRHFFSAGKIVGAIGHSVQLLINANACEGTQLTSAPSNHKEFINAGALWANQDVVVDNNLITCRYAFDLDLFTKEILENLREHVHLPY